MDDIENYITQQLGSFNGYQIRIQGFLSERIAKIFYHKYFGDSRIKVYQFISGDEMSPKSSSDFTKILKKEKKITLNKIIILNILLIVILIIKCFRKIKKQKNKNKFKIKKMKRRKNRKKKICF